MSEEERSVPRAIFKRRWIRCNRLAVGGEREGEFGVDPIVAKKTE